MDQTGRLRNTAKERDRQEKKKTTYRWRERKRERGVKREVQIETGIVRRDKG